MANAKGRPYCVKPELDDGSVVEFTDLGPNGDASLLFLFILLIPFSGASICICVLEKEHSTWQANCQVGRATCPTQYLTDWHLLK